MLAVPVAAGGATMATLFPEGGDDRFVATAFWPMLAVAVAGTALLAPGRRALRAGALLYVAVLVGAFVIPTPFGQNALRLPVLLGPALLVLAPRAAAPRAAIAAVVVALVYLQWLPAVRAVAEAHGDPVDRGVVLRRAAGIPRGRRPAGRARGGGVHAQPLGGGRTWPPPCRWRAAGSASSTRRPTRCSTTAAR